VRCLEECIDVQYMVRVWTIRLMSCSLARVGIVSFGVTSCHEANAQQRHPIYMYSAQPIDLMKYVMIINLMNFEFF
jgi:hypothetical protein